MAHPALASIAEMLVEAGARGDDFKSDLSPVSAEQIQLLQTSYPGVPDDYLDFLRLIGPGSLLSCSYVVYGELVEPSEIFESHDESWPEDLMVFGDNFSGDLGVFLPSAGWAVAELWHDDRSLVKRDLSFADYLCGLIANLTQDL